MHSEDEWKTRGQVFNGKIHLWRDWSYDPESVRIRLFDPTTRAFANPLVFTTIPPLMVEVPATVILSKDAAQALADELWNAGVRPSGAAGSAGQLTAVTRHLDDMRSLAFGALKMPGQMP